MPARLPLISAALAVGIAIGFGSGLGSMWAVGWLGLAVCALAIGPAARAPALRVFAVSALVGVALAAAHRADRVPAQRHGGTGGGEELRDEVVTGRVRAVVPGRYFDLDADSPVSARVRVFSRRARVELGDRARVLGRLRPLHSPRIPGAPRRPNRPQWRMSAPPNRIRRQPASGWRSAAARARRAIAGRIESRGGDARGNAAVRAMVIGDRSALDEAVSRPFRAAGLSHVLAVSGLHLAAVAFVLFVLIRRLWSAIPALFLRWSADRAAAIAALAAAIAYTAITGARPSTVRAGIAACVVLVGVLCRRRTRAVDAIAVAALAMLATDPAALFDPSFQLSFAAATALTLVFGRARRRRVTALGIASVWATLATAPLVVAWFGELPVAGVVANVFAVPIVELVILPLGLIGTALSWLAEPLGGAVIDLAVWVAGLLVRLAEALAGALPPIEIAPLSGIELGLAGLAIALAIAATRSRHWRRRAIAGCVSATLALGGVRLWTAEIRPRLSTDLVVAFVDVGQADAAVVELPGNRAWLIDAGGRGALQYLRHRRIDHLDLVVISHRHPDHYAGLAELLGSIAIDELWLTPGPMPPDLTMMLAALEASGTRVRSPVVGALLSLGDVTAVVLAPGGNHSPARADPEQSENDNSLVLRLDYAGRRLLFLGDVERDAERDLLGDNPDALAADVVKVAHHGSRTSSTQELVRATRAKVAVVSCGEDNRFGFPHEEVVARWENAGARLWRTDRDGTVIVEVSEEGAVSVTGTP